MLVVSAGARYIDIDAYACCVAYAELLNLLGKPAIAASSALWNESITESLRALNAPMRTDYKPSSEDRFIMVDLSDPSHFDSIVDVERVIEVLDHHPGYEQYWADKIGENSHIEFIGAAATLIYERWVKSSKVDNITVVSAQLLCAAILDNTLNFGAGVTTERDREAFRVLSSLANLDAEWAARYFSECQKSIVSDLPAALRNDTKFLTFEGLDEDLCLGQMVIWDAKAVVEKELSTIIDVMGRMSNRWALNLVSISENTSYFVSTNDDVKNWIEALLRVVFKKHVARADRMWLRKEIMKVGKGK